MISSTVKCTHQSRRKQVDALGRRSCLMVWLAGCIVSGCATRRSPSAAAARGEPHFSAWIEPRTRPAGPPNAQAQWRAAQISIAAMNFLDTPYVFGGSAPHTGFDCSGFTQHVFQAVANIHLPRRSEEQAHAPGFDDVDLHDILAGDLVFFNTLQRPFSHVGISLGEGRFVHAPRTGAHIRTDHLRSAYWAPRFNLARRPR